MDTSMFGESNLLIVVEVVTAVMEDLWLDEKNQ
jgi:hypothetical protein